MRRPTLFENPFASGQMRFFVLAEAPGAEGWLKAVRLDDYVLRRPRRPRILQQAPFAYHEAWAP